VTQLLTEIERRRYREDGLVFPIRVLSPEQARTYRLACDELEEQLGGKPRTVEVRQMHLHFRWAFELATQPRVLDAVEAILGPDLLVWTTELFAKHAHDTAVSIGWHRDRPYMGLAGESTTAWVALSDSRAANGCMRAVPDPGRRQNPERAGRPGREVVGEGDEREVVDVLLEAGEMSLHDADVLHGSAPNHSEEKRVGFVIRFVTPQTRPFTGRPPVILARGGDHHNNFHLVDPPVENSERALAGMIASAERHLEAMLQNLRRPGS
jgi:ectoine hydroxylase-related dioxygenase (phytanoyl-CoA dioxygenase family)